jgi:hypothetical protein
MADYVESAFHRLCDPPAIEPGARRFVSLYRQERFYGGPEEGGWWGTDWVRVSSREYPTAASARAAAAAVQSLADRLSREAATAHGLQCAAECEWLESRGLDADWLPEPDGPEVYSVKVERTPGWFESRGPRHYE